MLRVQIGRLFAVCLCLLAGWVLSACDLLGSSCPVEDEYCDGPTVSHRCDEATNKLTRELCSSGTTCVETVLGVKCAQSAEPVPECGEYPDSVSPGLVCVGDTMSVCVAGYPVHDYPCNETCVDTIACGAVCTSDPVAEHPACNRPDADSVCNGATRIDCGCDGTPPSEQECESFCAVIPAYGGQPARAICSESSEVDPRCPNYPEKFCDGDQMVICDDGYIVDRTQCQHCSRNSYGDVTCI